MKRVEDFNDLKKIVSVSWSLKEDAEGDYLFSPERSSVRFEDEEGNYWELCVYWVVWSDKMKEYHEYIAGRILNCIFHSLGLLKGKWIGSDCTLSDAVNQCRKELPRGTVDKQREINRDVYVL